LITLCSLMVMVSAHADCTPTPTGLVAWWQAESNYVNSIDGNAAASAGASFDSGEVGAGFVLAGSVIAVGDPASLHLQNFTIEGWVKRASASIATVDSGYDFGSILSWGDGGYQLNMVNGGAFGIKRSEIGSIYSEGVLSSKVAVTDTNFHHIAVTKEGTNVVFYLDGVSEVAKPYDPG